MRKKTTHQETENRKDWTELENLLKTNPKETIDIICSYRDKRLIENALNFYSTRSQEMAKKPESVYANWLGSVKPYRDRLREALRDIQYAEERIVNGELQERAWADSNREIRCRKERYFPD